MGSAVMEVIAEELGRDIKKMPLIKMIGINDSFGESGKAAELMEKYQLTADKILEQSKKIVVVPDEVEMTEEEFWNMNMLG